MKNYANNRTWSYPTRTMYLHLKPSGQITTVVLTVVFVLIMLFFLLP